ncbi:hypothetical protein I312_106024 [Cryptococcus bacillisporus CA1280]|uniref:uncharacterized protein n=1 Tax=Cryptococcus bacillisporus CA1280 TaxID=1296109 RepID=UPI0033688710
MPDNKTLVADVGAAHLEDDKAAYQNPTMTITPVVEQEYSEKERYDIDPFEAQREARGENYVEFRTMGWIQAGLVSTAESIALGLLSFPSIFLRLGMVGGVITTVGAGILAYFTAWIMVDFKLKHPGVMHFGDAGGVLFGNWGRRILGIGLSMGLAASHALIGKQALSILSSNAICSVWYALIVCIASVLMSVSREFGKLSLMSFISISAILIASGITIIATGIQDSSVLARNGVPIAWHAIPTDPTLVDVIGGLTNVFFAYGGNMAVFSFCSEMKRPQDFKKSFIIVQGLGILSYTVVGATIYAFGGQYVTSPALTMTTRPVRITAYSIALVTIMISGIIAVNVGAKYLYIVVFRRKDLLTSPSIKARLSWVGLVAFMWTVGFIIAELIPFFNQLLTIISSLFSVWFTFGLCGVMWFYDIHPLFAKNDESRALDTPMKKFLYICSIIAIVLSVATVPLGLYSAAESIRAGYSAGTFSHPFSC